MRKYWRLIMLIRNKQAVSPRGKVKGFAFGIMAVLMLSLMSTVTVQAIVPVPLGWTLYYAGLSLPGSPYQGVRVYRKTNSRGTYDYVTIVDVRYGTLRNLTGEPSGTNYDMKVKRYGLSEFWSRAVRQNTTSRKAAVVINGTFFYPFANPTTISYGLKADYWIMSLGFDRYASKYSGKVRTFAFDTKYGSSSIQPYYPDDGSIFWGPIPNVVGGLDPTADKEPSASKQRTFAGVRDDNRDGHSETIIFFVSKYATQSRAASVLGSFGAGSKMMLDGGSSTSMYVKGQEVITGSTAIVPQVFVIYTGK
jgi:hypothetical protein